MNTNKQDNNLVESKVSFDVINANIIVIIG